MQGQLNSEELWKLLFQESENIYFVQQRKEMFYSIKKVIFVFRTILNLISWRRSFAVS